MKTATHMPIWYQILELLDWCLAAIVYHGISFLEKLEEVQNTTGHFTIESKPGDKGE